MSEFVTAVYAMGQLLEKGSQGEVLANPNWTIEAEQVSPCVERFVIGEMDPTRRLAATRRLRGAPPTLAEKLGRKLDGAGPELLAGTRRAVNKAVAMGYVSYAITEPSTGIEVVADRDPRDIWDFWAVNWRDRLENSGIPKDWARGAMGAGSDVLVVELKELGLVRFLGGSKVNQLGMLYSQAGVVLRMTQTTVVDEEGLRQGLERIRFREDRPWKWDDYPC